MSGTGKMDQAEKLLELKSMLDRGLIDEKQFMKLSNQILQQSATTSVQDQGKPHQMNDSVRQPGIFKNRNILLGFGAAIIILLAFIFIMRSGSTSEKLTDITMQNSENDNTVITDNGDFQPSKIYNRPNLLQYPLPSSFYENVLTESLYPIGWSKDGKFAFLTIHPNEASNCERVIFLIQDMVTDKILFQLNSRDYCNDELNGLFLRAWNAMQKQISAKLNQFMIQQSSSFALQRFPLPFNGSIYDIHKYNRYGGLDDFGHSQIAATALHIKKNDVIGTKIFRINYTQDPPIDNGVVGYLKSPFENRLAVIYLTERRGYEGPPHVVNYELIGCEIGGQY